jgi:hypothetical protein
MVRCAVIGELDMHGTAGKRRTIEFNRGDPSRNVLRVLDDDFIARGMIAECDLKALPCTRDTRVEMKACAPQPESQEPFDAGPIQPSR